MGVVSDGDSRERQDLLKLGTEMTGAAAGAAVGLFASGPAGALAGAALGPAAAQSLRWAITEVGDRVLGRRGRQRAMGAAIYAAQKLEALREQGAEIRKDGFFERDPAELSSAEELAEGVLMAAQSSFEERKVRHLGFLYANTAIDEGIDRYLAAMALRKAQELSWRQYVLLAMVGARDEVELPEGSLSDNPGTWTAWGAMRELRDLFDSGLVHAGTKKTENLGLRIHGDALAELQLATQGQLLHHLLSLDSVPRPDVLDLIRVLARDPAPPE